MKTLHGLVRRKLSNEEGNASSLLNGSVVWVRCLSCFKQLVWVAGCPLSEAAKQAKKTRRLM